MVMERDMDMDTKPASFARGVPAEQANGFYGIEDELIEEAGGEPIVAVVTYVVDEVVEKRVAAAIKLRDEAYKVRTGQDALDLPEVDEA